MIKLFFTFVSLLRIPYKNREYLAALRLAKLRKILIHAKSNVPFYQNKYSELRLDRIKTLNDIKFVPILKPTELRKEKIENITAVNLQKKNLLLQSTSGTSGMPFRFYYSKEEELMRQLKLLRFLYYYGWKPWWKGVNIWRDIEKKSGSLFQNFINKRRFFVSINLPVEEQAQHLLSIEPQIIYGMTDSLEILANWMLENGVLYKKARLILTGGSTLTLDISEKLRKVYGHPVIDMYGFVEGGYLAGDCPHCGLKYFDDDTCILEILDENSEPVRPGEKGRAVITILDQYSTPIIRYDIGDYITTPEDKVDCKNRFTHYLSTDGRVADKLNLANGMTLLYQHLAPVREIPGIKQFQIIRKQNGELIFKYVSKSDTYNKGIEKLVPEKVSLLRHSEMSFEKCDSIPLEPSGKFKMVKEEA